ncbi:NUDIX domain-containing protein [Paenibacillus sp. N3.4]|nr:NUDIX domain-containing protein [Paenibacillus sp. N3.4]
MNNVEEVFDIYDANMNNIGTAPRSEVHAKGLWHQTFQCWIVSHEAPEPKLLLQLRHPDKDLFPSLLDISCAGHLSAGETIQDGVRELEEELGLRVNFSDLLACGVFAEDDILSERLIDREFCHVFIYRCDQPLNDYLLQPDEVSGIVAVNAMELERLVKQEAEQIKASGFKLQEDGQLEEVHSVIVLTDLVPHPIAYFDLLFRTLKQNHWLA